MSNRKKIISLFTVLLLTAAAVSVAFNFSGSDKRDTSSKGFASAELTSSETVDIVVDADTAYKLIYSSDSYQGDQQIAKELDALITAAPANKFRPVPDTAAESEFEILIGATDRAYSGELLEALNSYGSLEERYIWGFGYKDGKLAFVANSSIGYELGKGEFLALVSAEGTLSVPSDLLVINSMTVEDYEELLREQEEARKEEYIRELLEMNAAFSSEKLLTEGYKGMIGAEGAYFKESPYDAPWVYPAEGEHPRYLLTKKSVENIKKMKDDPEYRDLFYHLEKYAEKDIYNGVFPVKNGTHGTYRYDTDVLAGISARAMMYLLTGEEYYAYEAIVSIKNAMLTLNFTEDIHMDVYHGSSHMMVVLAAVYDWCYPVLTEEDKAQLITGSVNCLTPAMEMGYPPVKYNGVTGHGTGPQLLRDYMSLAIAFYDEAPDWWELVGGRYFEEYLPAVNLQYESGWISQGTATYAPIKVLAQLWAANLIKVATGENFLTEDASLGMQFFVSHIMPNGNYFQTGDGERLSDGSAPGFAEYFVSAALFNDPVALAWAKYHSDDYTKHDKGFLFTMTPDFQLCFISAVKAASVEITDEIELVQYFADPAGQMTARNSWEDDAAAVFMKIGNVTMSDHDVYDHGTFQIYYKGLLAGTSGSYKEYGGDTHYYYLQATVAHNGLLVFNPAKAQDAKLNGNDVLNPAGYYYSGSQHRLGAPDSVEKWQNGTYRMATTTGASWAYGKDGSVEYAYIAGDITAAYDDVTVDHVERRMFTLYTGNAEIPMVFFTFDDITSKSENFEKTFLLHTVKEPTVDEENLTATVINGDGRLVLNSLYGADRIEKVGGEGMAYWINDYYKEDGTYVPGKNCLDEYTPDDNSANIWGRVQLRASGELTTKFLTAMYVTDASSTAVLDIQKYQNESVYVAAFDDSIVVFYSGSDKAYKAFSFESSGMGLYNYYLSGIADGTWSVKVDGVLVARAQSSDEEGMISFIAPAGKVELIPGQDVIGANGGKIEYVTGGAILPDDAPYSYNNEEPTALPETAFRGDDKFLGWYTDPAYTEDSRMYFIPEGTEGTVTLYAKWRLVPTNENYSDNTGDKAIFVEGKNSTVDGITYSTAKAGISISTAAGEDGNTYLSVNHNGVRGQAVVRTTDLVQNISTFLDTAISFEISLKKLPGVDLSTVYWDFLTSSSAGGSGSLGIITVSSDGNVLLCGAKNIGSVSEDEFTKFRIGVDFAEGTISAYDEWGNAYETLKPTAPTGFESLAQWQREGLMPHLLYLGIYNMNEADENGAAEPSAILIDDVKVAEGIIFGKDGESTTPDGGIEYVLNGGSLPVDIPRVYDPELGTLLPEPTRSGHIFAGWYTDAEFTPESKTYYVPAGTTGVFRAYAKWYAVYSDEDYTDADISVEGKTATIDSVMYNSAKAGITLTSKTDAGGNSYLCIEHNAIRGQSFISTANASAFKETAVTFEISLAGVEGKTVSAVIFEHQDADKNKLQFIDMLTSGGDTAQITFKGSSTVIGTIKPGEFTTFRITVDFAEKRISAYDEEGNVIDSILANTLSASGKFNFYVYNLNTADENGVIASSALLVDDIKFIDGVTYGEKKVTELPPPTAIRYNLSGGTLPEDVPTEYNPDAETLLPEEAYRKGYIFDGWYTDSELGEESRIYAIPAGQKGVFDVYAKWLTVPTDESFANTDINVEGTNSTVNGITYSSAKAGLVISTETDDDGNTYLAVNHNGVRGQAVVRTTSTAYNISTFNEDAVSFEISLKKLPGVDLSTVYWDFLTGSGGSGSLGIVTVNPDGSIMLCGSKNIGTVTEDGFTDIKICVDFALGTVSAYGADGNVIETLTPEAPAGFESLAQWQREGLKPHMLYLGIYNMNEADGNGIIESSAILIDNVRVVDGRLW